MSSSGDAAVPGSAYQTFEITAENLSGPEIWNNESFTPKNYGEQVSNTKEIQGDELPTEWLLQARSGWSRATTVTWRVGMLALVLSILPFVLMSSLFVLGVVGWRVPRWLVWCSDFLNNPWVSGILNIVAIFLAIKIVKRTWRFVANESFRKAKT